MSADKTRGTLGKNALDAKKTANKGIYMRSCPTFVSTYAEEILRNILTFVINETNIGLSRMPEQNLLSLTSRFYGKKAAPNDIFILFNFYF